MANRLKDASSPYLLQHADNPVDWLEWGDEAFSRAREHTSRSFCPWATRAATGVTSWPLRWPLTCGFSPDSSGSDQRLSTQFG